MKDNTKDYLSNYFLKELLKSDFLSNLEQLTSESYSIPDLIRCLRNANNVDSFLLRYPKTIISKAVADNLLSVKYYENFKEIFSDYNIEFISNKIQQNKSTNETKSHDHFEVKIRAMPFNGWEKLLTHIKNNFEVSNSNFDNIIYIPLNELEKFMAKYYECKIIDWEKFSGNEKISWTNDLITKYNKTWNWPSLHKNSSIKWSFELLDNNQEYIHWEFMADCHDLKWGTQELLKFKDKLIFSVNRRYSSDYIIDPARIEEDRHKSISLSSNIKWSKDLIEALIDYWDWTELSINPSIHWNAEMVNYFSESIDFKSLSLNHNVQWTEALLDKYADKLNWESLSGNPNMPWSADIISKYEDKWFWVPRHLHYDNYDLQKFSSISNNSGIRWNLNLLKKWGDRLDFWIIALRGNLSNEILKEYKNEFYRKELTDRKVHRWSDSTYTEKLFRTGWENMSLNKNILLNPDVIEFLYNQKIKLKYSVGNLARDNFQQQNYHFEEVHITLLELLKSKTIKDLSLNTLIQNETSWGKVLINDHFINDSIWNIICDYIEEDSNYLWNYLQEINESEVLSSKLNRNQNSH